MEQGNGISRGSSVYKVPGGKLIKVWLEASGNTLVDIRLTGDFFIHPEEWIASLEEAFRGASIDDVPDMVREKAGEENVQLIGIEPDDIIHAIGLAFEVAH